MPVSNQDQQLVEKMFKAMQAGAAGLDDMMRLYTDDAVIVEPFSGEVQTHSGKADVQAFFEGTFEHGPPLTLKMDRVDMDGPRVKAEWTCTSPVFTGPMKGHDLFTIVGGLIKRLEINVTEMPEFNEPH